MLDLNEVFTVLQIKSEDVQVNFTGLDIRLNNDQVEKQMQKYICI